MNPQKQKIKNLHSTYIGLLREYGEGKKRFNIKELTSFGNTIIEFADLLEQIPPSEVTSMIYSAQAILFPNDKT